jgi:hypothetical protein
MWLNQTSGIVPNSAANSLPAPSGYPENSAAGGAVISSQDTDTKPTFTIESALSTEETRFFPDSREVEGGLQCLVSA